MFGYPCSESPATNKRTSIGKKPPNQFSPRKTQTPVVRTPTTRMPLKYVRNAQEETGGDEFYLELDKRRSSEDSSPRNAARQARGLG